MGLIFQFFFSKHFFFSFSRRILEDLLGGVRVRGLHEDFLLSPPIIPSAILVNVGRGEFLSCAGFSSSSQTQPHVRYTLSSYRFLCALRVPSSGRHGRLAKFFSSPSDVFHFLGDSQSFSFLRLENSCRYGVFSFRRGDLSFFLGKEKHTAEREEERTKSSPMVIGIHVTQNNERTNGRFFFTASLSFFF